VKTRLGLSLLALSLTALASAQTFSVQELRAHVSYLASDALAGRGSGTRGNEQAARYIADQFRKAGLKPLGTKKQGDAKAKADGSGYFQPFTFPAGVAKGSNNRLTVSGVGRYAVGQAFEPSPLSASGTASGTLVYVDYGIVSSEGNRDDYAGKDVRGKVVLARAGSPAGNDIHSPLFDAGNLRRKAVIAREKGATALLVIAADDAALRFEEGDGTDAGLPILVVRKTVAESWLAKNAPLTVTLTADVRKVTRTSANIAGLLVGSDPTLREEVVVVGAHMDHLGMGGTHSLAEKRTPAIHHGADDNASGTAGVLALAAHYAKNPPRRSVLFLCFSGEELGLLGSAYYVKNPLVSLEKTVAMVNMDMIGRLDNNKLVVVGSGTSPSWNPLLDDLNARAGFTLSRSESGFGASDQQSFYNAKIPVLFFFTGLHSDYHRPSDTAEKINYDGEAKVLALVAQATTRIANTPERPGYTQIRVAQEQPARFRVSLGSIPDYGYEGEGVLLSGVRPGSAAEKAGLQKGDILVRFNGRAVKNVQEYTLALGDCKPGDTVEVVVKRGAEIVTVKATLAASGGR
jgi:hypothetical protein